MASTYLDSAFCLTGDLREIDATSGAPTAQATTKFSGDYAYQLRANIFDAIRLVSGDIAAVGDTRTYAFKWRFDDLSPATAQTSFFVYDQTTGGVAAFKLRLDTNGDLLITESDNTVIGTITAPFTVDTWHYMRVDVEFHSTAGKIRVEVDGTGSEWTNVKTHAGVSVTYSNFQTNTDAGNLYVDSLMIWDTTEWKPTDIPSDLAKGGAHTSGLASQTDLGDATSAGNWANTGEIPLNVSTQIDMNNNPHLSGMDTDNGANAGPSGVTFSPAIGTIIGAKAGVYWKSSKTESNRYLYYGNSSETWETGLGAYGPVDVGAAFEWHELFFDDAHVPSTSEYFRLGLKNDDKWDLDAAWLGASLIYEPAAPGGGWGGKVGGVSSPAKVGGVAPGKVGGV